MFHAELGPFLKPPYPSLEVHHNMTPVTLIPRLEASKACSRHANICLSSAFDICLGPVIEFKDLMDRFA